MNGDDVDVYGHAGVAEGVPVGGPGVPEPPAALVARTWKTKAFSHTAGEHWVYFFRLIDGRVMCYNPGKRTWKIWRPKKPIVLSSDPRLSQVRRAERAVFGKLKSLAKRSDYLTMAKKR